MHLASFLHDFAAPVETLIARGGGGAANIGDDLPWVAEALRTG